VHALTVRSFGPISYRFLEERAASGRLTRALACIGPLSSPLAQCAGTIFKNFHAGLDARPGSQVGHALKRNSPLARRTKAALGRRTILNNASDWNRVFA
jgi:hypothetical protein